jgi:hypothetical protein
MSGSVLLLPLYSFMPLDRDTFTFRFCVCNIIGSVVRFCVRWVKYSFFIVSFVWKISESLTDFFLFLLWSLVPVTHTLLKIHYSDTMIGLFVAVFDKCQYSLNLSAGGQGLVTVW